MNAKSLDLQNVCFPPREKLDFGTENNGQCSNNSATEAIDVQMAKKVLASELPLDAIGRPLETSRCDAVSEEECHSGMDDLIGTSWGMRLVYDQLERIAGTESTVLVVGETGTGKELAVRSLHRRSRRSHMPLVAVNCAALSETLLESELFGHVRGAFTDARTDRKGFFVQADGGTLLLDEIGEMPRGMQAKLLRALEEGTIRPVGSEKEIHVNVRLIAATHRNLEKAVEEGRFREDLYYRIHVISLELPPLRDRERDALLLARHFTRQFAERHGKDVTEIAPAAAEKLCEYGWPGNVRELKNVIERAVALTPHTKLSLEDLPEKIRTCSSREHFPPPSELSSLISLEEVKWRYIRHVLRSAGGNKKLAAKILGIDRKTLYRKFGQLEGEH